jgi:hypothetical protein
LGLEGIEAIVFRTVGDQPSLFESVLPPELLRLPEELARVDILPDDPVFFAPFVPLLDSRIGQPSTPNGCWSTPGVRYTGHARRPSRCGVSGEHDPAAGRRRGRLARAVNDLTELLAATRQIATQTQQRMSGVTPGGATCRVSLHDPDARPIAKGRLGKPVEFGHKAQVVDNADGVALDYTIELGNPAAAPQLAPAIERVINRTGRTPSTVTAGRGYGEKSVDDALTTSAPAML